MRNFLLLVILIVGIAIYQSSSGQKTKTGPVTGREAVSPAAMTDQEAQALLERGRAVDKKLADANKPRPPGSKADFVFVSQVEYAKVRGDLLLIPDNNTAAPEAKRLVASLDKRNAEGEEIARKAFEKARAENVAGRKSFAIEYEHELLRKGLSVTVTAEGDRSSTLRVRYVLVSKALAFQISESHKLLDQLREVGFRKLILSDGYNETWSLQL